MALTPLSKSIINSSISRIVGVRDGFVIEPEQHLNSDIGADSLDDVEIVMALEDAFGIEISDEELGTMPGRTVQDIYDNMEAKLQGTSWVE